MKEDSMSDLGKGLAMYYFSNRVEQEQLCSWELSEVVIEQNWDVLLPGFQVHCVFGVWLLC